MTNSRVLFLGRYGSQAASTRYRALQYLPYLQEHGIDVHARALLDDDYVQRLYSGKRPNYPSIARNYVSRVRNWSSPENYDLVWVQYEALPFFPAWVESAFGPKTPYIVDYDDAVFHGYDQHKNPIVRKLLGNKIDVVMKNSALVIAGNPYIAERAVNAGARLVTVLPTVIDLERYPPSTYPFNDTFTIGWIGTPVTARYLKALEPIFQLLSQLMPIKVLAIGASGLKLEGVPYEIVPWSEETEVSSIQRCDVGLMPLDDTLWERGKCGFKLIQYMACGIPIIGTPIGVNKEIIIEGVNGFQAESSEKWLSSLITLSNDRTLRGKMGQAGRMLVESKYCLQQTAPRLVELLNRVKEQANVRH